MTARTISEKILSAKSGIDVRAGDVVFCNVDRVIGTDASTPMAIDYFERMGGDRIFDPARVMFALDHYSPPTSDKTRDFHERMRRFARRFGAELHEAGEGISFQIAMELGRVLPGDLVIGADSHTVTCGALNSFTTGLGSSDLAAAMITGQVWLRVPSTIKVVLDGARAPGAGAKDIALALVSMLGPEGANYQALEFEGSAVATLSLEERMVVCNLAVELGAKAAIFPCDALTTDYLAARTTRSGTPVSADAGAQYAQVVTLDIGAVSPQAARPHAPDNVTDLAACAGTPIHMVFLGTCTGGRVPDFHEALAVLEAMGGRVSESVQLVLTPASREVEMRLREDGTLAKFEKMGAIITLPGCGACCGTSGVIPRDGMNVLSTANRNFKARMGNATASIYLASPASCAAAAATGVITTPPGSRNPEGNELSSRHSRESAPQSRHSRESGNPFSGNMDSRLRGNDEAVVMHGRARKLGDDINTDYIITSQRKRETLDESVLRQYLLETVDPSFAASVRDSDLIVAGRNFGCGSAMEIAATVILAAGIKAVLAQSFSRTFYRNAVNNGLLPIECDTKTIREGDFLSIHSTGDAIEVGNTSRGIASPGAPIAALMREILEAGGLVEFVRRRRR